MKRCNFIIFFMLFIVPISALCNEKVISIKTLLNEMVDRRNLPQYPKPYYECKQFSSYDRATTTPEDKSWFANWDRSMFIRVDSLDNRKEYVLMDIDGPGAIVRFWMTFAGSNAGEGTLRIYFDNSKEPAIVGKALDIVGGSLVVGAPLSTSVSDLTKYERRGHNLYMPLPYATHCKVTYESENIKGFGAKRGGEAVYYNINYRTYEGDTKVKTYSKKELDKNRTLLSEVQAQLQKREIIIPQNSDTTLLKGEILPDACLTKQIYSRNGAIRKLSFKVKSSHIEQALRSTILSISFDGNRTVYTPLGDFFGTGYQVRPSHTWYTHVDAEGEMSCYWVMPYSESCEVSLHNVGTESVTVQMGEIITAPYSWDKNTMYFGSSWKQFSDLKTGKFKSNEGDGDPFDINYVELNGRGLYVGDGITLFNTVDAWWGEGDEKIYIDGETFPSHIGTGTEDYYGYAWCRPERISNHPFIAQPDGSGNFHPGYTVNLRFRSLDAIPFKSSIKFDMEMWHWVEATIDFAPITYWYISPKSAVQTTLDLNEVKKLVSLTKEDLGL